MLENQIDNLSLEEMRQLRITLDEKIAKRETADREEVRKQIIQMADKVGLRLSDVLTDGGHKKKQVRRPATVKYVHPHDKTQTWTGRGRKPFWLEEFLKKGGTIEQCQV